jgi:hypothetical protein
MELVTLLNEPFCEAGVPRLCRAAAVTLHVHFRNGRVMHQQVNRSLRHGRRHKHRASVTGKTLDGG